MPGTDVLPLYIKVNTFVDYRIAGKFGGGKVWQIWQITRCSPN